MLYGFKGLRNYKAKFATHWEPRYIAGPRGMAQRGSHVSLHHPQGYAVMQSLIASHVIGDFRAPDMMRFGFTPLYVGFEDVWNAVEHLRQVLDSGEWQRPEFNQAHAVT